MTIIDAESRVTDSRAHGNGPRDTRNARLDIFRDAYPSWRYEQEQRLRELESDGNVRSFFLKAAIDRTPTQWAVQEMVRGAKQSCQWCADCGSDLAPDDLAVIVNAGQWPQPVPIADPTHYFGDEQAPICRSCATIRSEKMGLVGATASRYNAKSEMWANFHLRRLDLARPCENCERPVVAAAMRRWGSHTCCRDCSNAVRYARRHVEHDPIPCETCSEMFTPKRSDARYCSSPCRQRAYRSRRSA